jgi:hypothetical protein
LFGKVPAITPITTDADSPVLAHVPGFRADCADARESRAVHEEPSCGAHLLSQYAGMGRDYLLLKIVTSVILLLIAWLVLLRFAILPKKGAGE